MEKKNIKKYLIILVSGIVIVFGIRIGYCCTYVGNIVVSYPWDELKASEKIAMLIMGYGKTPTKQELYDQGLISENQVVYQKFNDSYYKRNSTNSIDCNFEKSELENMYINPEKYIGQDIEFAGKITSEIGITEDMRQIVIDSSASEEDAQKTIEAMENSDKDIITVRIDNTNVLILMACDKSKIDYSNWKKGTSVKVQGKIKTIEQEYNTETINLYDNPIIE